MERLKAVAKGLLDILLSNITSKYCLFQEIQGKCNVFEAYLNPC
jgi:hypothetical protein